jgi:hypothetical protein
VAPAASAPGAPRLLDLRVTTGAPPYAGDGPLLATVSPNGDGFRDRAVVRFRLTAAATVELAVVRTETVREKPAPPEVLARTRARLRAGDGSLAWAPARGTAPRTYILRLTVTGAGGRRIYGAYGPGGRPDTPVVRVQGIDAGFTRRSYAPGESAELSVACDAATLSLQVFAYSGGAFPTQRDVLTSGTAMTEAVTIPWGAHRDAPAQLRVARAGNWRSGLYFLRLSSGDGRVGYAPFIVRPRQLGQHRVAVVLATNTWQAYNFWDGDGNGWGDSWYVSGERRTVDLQRPYQDFGIPYRFGDWDLELITWLEQTGKQVDVVSDDDLAAVASGDMLARAYDLVVFPGHEEYVTQHMYDVVRRYRDLGGNLAFLSANNFFWRVRRTGSTMTKERQWRDLRRPEAGLVGVQYVGSNHGAKQSPFVVADASSWAFAGTGLRNGDTFGRYGIEIDARSPASPPGTQVLASIPDLIGPGRSAEMTYYETAAGARVFAAGTLNFAASIGDPVVGRLMENVWARLAQP